MSLPAVIFVGMLDMIITNTVPRAFLSGRRYHANPQDAIATFSACRYERKVYEILSWIFLVAHDKISHSNVRVRVRGQYSKCTTVIYVRLQRETFFLSTLLSTCLDITLSGKFAVKSQEFPHPIYDARFSIQRATK